MTDAFVVDASVAVKWFVTEDASDRAEDLLRSNLDLHAPRLLKLELANALRKNAEKTFISRDQAVDGLASVSRTIGRWHDLDDVLPRAFSWALRYDHPVYDFCYLALAEKLGLRMVTADEAFLRLIVGEAEAKLAVSLQDAS